MSCYLLRLAVWFWFVFCALSLHDYVYAAENFNCNNCQCCINQKCSPAKGWHDICGKGCIDGHRGIRCRELCQYEHCKTCGAPFSNNKSCTACYDGYYLGPKSDCISVCPPNCKTCTSSSVCDECKKGFFNKNGSTKCEYSDCPGNCVCPIYKNECTSCRLGYFNKTSNCSDVCPTNCVSCTSREICTSCKNGFYNGYKNNISTGVPLNNCTFKCKETCTQCFSYNNCSECPEGKFDQTCHSECALGCMGGQCLIETGGCNCSLNFTGDKCTECIDSKYGIFCNNSCPEFCQENKCSKLSGDCDCRDEYYGRFCNLSCSENCSFSNDKSKRLCDKIDGTCINGCLKGHYGFKCDNLCSSICIDNICDQNTGKCKHGCIGGKIGPECLKSSVTGKTLETNNLIGPVVGGIGVFVVAVAVSAVAAVIYRRRQLTKDVSDHIQLRQPEGTVKEGHVYENIRDKGKKQNENRVHVEQENMGKENVVTIGQNNEDKQDYYNFCQDSLNIKVADLFSYVTNRQTMLFEKDFENLPTPGNLSKVCKFAMKPENIALNRFNGIYPFDHSRVTIPSEPRFFINACYIDGYQRNKAYIASSGPTAKTTHRFSSFWCMVWQENSDVIVMLTNLREESGMKCEQYWPDADREEQYGQIKVKCRSVEEFSEYTVRTFTISKDKQERNLTQLHYTAWPDKGVPHEVTSLVEFRQRVKTVPAALDGPVIVHCSAGVGRTGTYIALDILTEQGKAEDSVDVFHCVSKMRDQRVNMVQTEEQYRFLHKAVVHSLTFDCEAVTAELIQRQAFETDDRFRQIFQTLRMVVDTETEDNIKAREENRKKYRDKSRQHSDIPGKYGRVRLILSRKSGSYDYINAMSINSFKTNNVLIAAQTPLPCTVEDFLCLIYQQSASCVVALESPQTVAKKSDVGKYLPADNETYRCGYFTVSCSKFETKPQYTLKKVSLHNMNKGEEISVYHFQYTKWKQGHNIADSASEFVHFIKDVGKYVSKEDTSPIVVHCLNGYERSGLFCVVYKLLEKLEAERQVSVVNIIREVRSKRRLAISSVEQLKFCYRCVSAYLESYSTYSNFAV